MKYTPTIHIDKKGREICIREANTNDADNLIQCISKYIIDSDYQVLLDHEFKPSTNEEEEWINAYVKADNSLLLIVEFKNKIIGNIDLKGGNKDRIKHTGIVGMGLDKDFRNSGIGGKMLNEIIAWAKKNKTLEMLWLQVFSNHKHGLHLYKKYGFEISGTQPGFIKYDNKKSVGKVIMTNYLNQ